MIREIVDVLSLELPPDIEAAFMPVREAFRDSGTGTPFYEVGSRSSRNDTDFFYNQFAMGVVEGLCSSYYHLQRFLEMEGYVQSKRSELAKLPSPSTGFGHGISLTTRKLTYEYEGFMLMSRATLDRLVAFFGYYFQNDLGNVYKMEKALRHSFAEHDRAKRMVAVIDKHREFLDTQISTDKNKRRTERDRLAHREFMGFGSLNIMYSPGQDLHIVVIPPDGTPEHHAGRVLTDRFRQLQEFVTEILQAFIGGSTPGNA